MQITKAISDLKNTQEALVKEVNRYKRDKSALTQQKVGIHFLLLADSHIWLWCAGKHPTRIFPRLRVGKLHTVAHRSIARPY